MLTEILWPWELPEYIDGIAVVCDVWAATTNINTILAKGVGELLIVNINNIQRAKKKYKNSLVVGQSLKSPKTFFNTSNYPYDVSKIGAKDKTVLYMSNNGSRIIELAFEKKAHTVFTVSFSNIKSFGKYLQKFNQRIYLIPSGEIEFVNPKVMEDLICVQSLDRLLRGEVVNLDKSREIAKAFIKKMYGYQDFDQESNFKTVLTTDDLKVIPICSQEKEGWISIKDTNNSF